MSRRGEILVGTLLALSGGVGSWVAYGWGRLTHKFWTDPTPMGGGLPEGHDGTADPQWGMLLIALALAVCGLYTVWRGLNLLVPRRWQRIARYRTRGHEALVGMLLVLCCLGTTLLSVGSIHWLLGNLKQGRYVVATVQVVPFWLCWLYTGWRGVAFLRGRAV